MTGTSEFHENVYSWTEFYALSSLTGFISKFNLTGFFVNNLVFKEEKFEGWLKFNHSYI